MVLNNELTHVFHEKNVLILHIAELSDYNNV